MVEGLEKDAPITVDIVIERQLLVLLNLSLGINSHPHSRSDRPLRDITVGITAVVCESSNTAALCCINKLCIYEWYRLGAAGSAGSGEVGDRGKGGYWKIDAASLVDVERWEGRNTTNLVFLQHHKVEMSNALICIIPHPLSE